MSLPYTQTPHTIIVPLPYVHNQHSNPCTLTQKLLRTWQWLHTKWKSSFSASSGRSPTHLLCSHLLHLPQPILCSPSSIFPRKPQRQSNIQSSSSLSTSGVWVVSIILASFLLGREAAALALALGVRCMPFNVLVTKPINASALLALSTSKACPCARDLPGAVREAKECVSFY